MADCQWLFEVWKTMLLVTGTFGVGQAVISHWQMKNKRRELDIIAATQFQQVYGEYKELWRLWKMYQDADRDKYAPEAHVWWNLLARATAAEAKVEAIVVKLVVERRLQPEDIRKLGLFRQGFQQLRQGIREGRPMRYNFRHPEYALFNKLASEVACMLLTDRRIRAPRPGDAVKQLTAITAIRQDDWRRTVGPIPEGAEESSSPMPAST